MNVLVIFEDFRKDQYIQPIIEAIFAALDKPGKAKDKMMSVTVKSMALSTAKERNNHLLTFAIEKPNFPMKFLQQGMIIEFQT